METTELNKYWKWAKPFTEDNDKIRYEWRDLIVWPPRAKLWYQTKRNSPDWLSIGAIFLFFMIMSYFPMDAEGSASLFTGFLILMFFIPIIVEYMEKVILVNQAVDKFIVHIKLRHVGLNKTFEIRDVVKNWYTKKHHPITGAVTTHNRGCIEIEFANKWHVGNHKNSHIFDSMHLWGNSRFLQSLDGFAPRYSLETDVFGVPIRVAVYEFSVLISEDGWASEIDQYVGLSWASRETSSEYKRVYPYLVLTQEEMVSICPYCELPLTDNELILTDHFKSHEWKSKAIQFASKAYHEEALKDQTMSRDFKYATLKEHTDEFYRESWTDKIRMPRGRREWIILGILVFVLLVILSPTLQGYLRELLGRFGGSGGQQTTTTTTPPVTTGEM